MIPKSKRSLFRPKILLNSNAILVSPPTQSRPLRHSYELDSCSIEAQSLSSKEEVDTQSSRSKLSVKPEYQESQTTEEAPALFKRASSIESLKDKLLGVLDIPDRDELINSRRPRQCTVYIKNYSKTRNTLRNQDSSNSFVSAESLPHSDSPMQYGKYWVRKFDGDMRETQTEVLRTQRTKKLKRDMSRIGGLSVCSETTRDTTRDNSWSATPTHERAASKRPRTVSKFTEEWASKVKRLLGEKKEEPTRKSCLSKFLSLSGAEKKNRDSIPQRSGRNSSLIFQQNQITFSKTRRKKKGRSFHSLQRDISGVLNSDRLGKQTHDIRTLQAISIQSFSHPHQSPRTQKVHMRAMKRLTGIVNKSLDNILVPLPSTPRKKSKKSRNDLQSPQGALNLRHSLLGPLIRLQSENESIRRTTEVFPENSALSPKERMNATHFSLRSARERHQERRQFKEYLKSEDFLNYLEQKELAKVEKLEDSIIRDVPLFSYIAPANQGKYAQEEEKREAACSRLLKNIKRTQIY